MDRTVADGATPESAGEPSGQLPQRRRGERLYRQPQPDSTEGTSWFGDAPAPPDPPAAAGSPASPGPVTAPSPAPAAAPVDPPEYGPASPGGPGRASFGFTAGPISGNRPLGGRDDADADAWPAAESASASGGLPVVRRRAADAAPTSPASPTSQGSPAAGPWTSLPSWETNNWASTLDPIPSLPPAPADAPPARPRPAPPPPRRRGSRLVTTGMAVLGVAAVLVIALTGVVFYSGPDSKVTQMLNLGGDGAAAGSRLVTAPLNGRTTASFEMLAASDRVRVTVADIGDDLFRISTPDDSPLRPSPQLDETGVRLQVTRQGDGADGEVDVVLAQSVRWTLRFSGYAAERDVDLGKGQVTGIEMVGGTRRAVMALSVPSGTVPVKITGGVDELTLKAPVGSPIRVKVGGGAATVTAGSRTLRDVAPGSTLTPKNWDAAGRYDVDAASKITLLNVEAG
ncbi:hypothetical protein GCM10010168_16410 [Actinoplanes ianthinogenes]|uniref:Uncharacterized protein n=1 Tax=Actinoplanes ianthinogenes TaxID=122358 RepID=A0ABN6CJ81_9ACTN|nr:hypothetical protein [Actinoplanes ianthinogenes]BCJ44828.1 hypothetical protein Aiant_54850 [Actinoplanes ianthinogenes]GGR00234.1 hypothetical protein GCM10010168_16410 [Actinoplanes ianthinogenes]